MRKGGSGEVVERKRGVNKGDRRDGGGNEGGDEVGGDEGGERRGEREGMRGVRMN